MSEYITNYVTHGGGTGAVKVSDPLQCLSPSQVPVICELASTFAVCDGWYSSMPGPTWPNRFFVMPLHLVTLLTVLLRATL